MYYEYHVEMMFRARRLAARWLVRSRTGSMSAWYMDRAEAHKRMLLSGRN